jgi:hypothetical protein
MAPRKRSRNDPCPCGSSRKYKHCCWGKGFDWVQDEQGQSYRAIPLSAESQALLQEQRQKYRQSFGHDPGPDDLVCFDAPPLEQVEHKLVEAMRRAGLDPAFVHAFEKTGLLVTEDNQQLIPEKDLQTWFSAVAKYRTQNPSPE